MANSAISDEKAALDEFTAIMDGALQKSKKDAIIVFASEFRRSYRYYSAEYGKMQWTRGTAKDPVVVSISVLPKITAQIKDSMRDDLSFKQQARGLAQSFGNIMCIIDNVLAEPKNWFTILKNKLGILNEFRNIKTVLGSKGYNVNTRFIKNRLKRIAKEKGKDMSKEQSAFIIELAKIFS